MHVNRRWFTQPTLALALVAVATTGWADLRVEVRESVNGSEPATVVHWFGKNRSTRDDGSRYIVTRLDLGKTFIINRRTKQYRVIDLHLDGRRPVPGVVVQPSDDLRVINGWSARRYRISGPAARGLTIDLWISNELNVDLDYFRQVMVRLGGRQGSAWLNAYREIKGFPVLQQVTLHQTGLRLESTSQVVAIEQREPQPFTYKPPPSYTRIQQANDELFGGIANQ